MSDATATTAPEAPAAPASDNSEPLDPLGNALASLPGEPETDINAETADSESEPEEKPLEKPKGKKSRVDYEALFTEEKLQTPEGVKAARDALLELKRESGRKHIELTNREERLKGALAKFRSEREQIQTTAQLLQGDLKALRTGKPDMALQALARLSGADPLKLLEEINLNFAGGGAKAETLAVQEMKQELAQLRNQLQEERQQAQERRNVAFVAQRKNELLQQASNAAEFPHLAELAKRNPRGVADNVASYIVREHDRGRRLDDRTALSHIEAELAEYRGTAAAPHGEAGRETSALAKPESGQAPRPPGKSLTPSLATRNGGGTRPLTPDEQSAALNASPDDILRDLGLPF